MNQDARSSTPVADEAVCILGLGYVGLTLATVLSDVGYKVTGVDRDEKLILGVRAGKPHFHEKGLEELLKTIARSATPPTYLTAMERSCTTVYVITVGTPILRPSMQPNLDYVRSATG